MNVEYIGVEGAKLDNAFISCDNLVSEFNNRLHEEEFVNEFCAPLQREGSYFYRTSNLCEQSEYKVEIMSVHENGIVVRIACLADLGTHKNNISTSALLIIRDNDVPKFIIDGVDSFVNKELSHDNDLVWSKVNQNVISEAMDSLGKRIDEPFYVGVRPKDTILTKGHNEKKRIEISTSILERLGEFSLYLDTIGREDNPSLNM